MTEQTIPYTQKEYLNIKEASKYLNIHPQTLRRWEDKGLIKPIRLLHPPHPRRYTMDQLNSLFHKPCSKCNELFENEKLSKIKQDDNTDLYFCNSCRDEAWS